jgi:hypothetical protein
MVAAAADRARTVHLYETDFRDLSLIEGVVSRAKPPKLLGNVLWMNDPDMRLSPAGGYGCVISCGRSDIIPVLKGAHVMGAVDSIREILRGRKFHVRNRYRDWVCVEIA